MMIIKGTGSGRVEVGWGGGWGATHTQGLTIEFSFASQCSWVDSCSCSSPYC